MFEQAIKDYGLDPSLCIACGDKLRDVERLPDIGMLKENTGVIDGVEFRSILDFYKKCHSSGIKHRTVAIVKRK